MIPRYMSLFLLSHNNSDMDNACYLKSCSISIQKIKTFPDYRPSSANQHLAPPSILKDFKSLLAWGL